MLSNTRVCSISQINVEDIPFKRSAEALQRNQQPKAQALGANNWGIGYKSFGSSYPGSLYIQQDIKEIKLDRSHHNTVGISHSLSNRSHGLRQSLVFPNTTGASKSTFLRMDHRVGGWGAGGVSSDWKHSTVIPVLNGNRTRYLILKQDVKWRWPEPTIQPPIQPATHPSNVVGFKNCQQSCSDIFTPDFLFVWIGTHVFYVGISKIIIFLFSIQKHNVEC